jgi:hypothetical protein
MKIVGDDQKPLVQAQGARHLLGGGADIHEQRRIIGDELRRPLADKLFLAGRQLPPRLIGDVLDAGRKKGSAMRARQQPLIAQIVEILADRLRGYIEMFGKPLDRNLARVAGDRENFVLPEVCRSHGPCLAGVSSRVSRNVNIRAPWHRLR